ncbi:MAG TPA: SHOCT domain-containing protein [Polyangiaceae bacterium]
MRAAVRVARRPTAIWWYLTGFPIAMPPLAKEQTLARAGAPGDRRILDFLDQVRGLLVPGEAIDAWAVQRRLFALKSRRVLVVATTGRLLVCSRKLLAGYTLLDIRWQDLSSVRIRVGMFAADLTVGFLGGGDLASAERSARTASVRGLRTPQALEVYRLCQAHDQAWREKRRIRELEEMRARAGGVQIGAGSPAGALPQAGGTEALTERLATAREMRDKGLITDAEYEALKAKIIAAL